jgi:ATP-binding cassette, subfamily B, bacterial
VLTWLRLVRPDWPALPALVPALLITTAASLAAPLVLRYGIDNGLSGSVHPAVLAQCALFYLVISVINAVVGIWQLRVVGRIGERFVRTIRVVAFRHLLGLDSAYFDANPAGGLVARLTADVDALQDLVQTGGVELVQTFLSLVFLLIVVTVLSWQLTLACLGLPLVVILLVIRRFRRDSTVANNEVRDKIGLTMGALAEGLAGIRIVQAFGQEARLFTHFLTFSSHQLHSYERAVRIESRFLRATEAGTAVTTVVAVAVGVVMVTHHVLSAGTLSAYVLYLLMLFDPLQSISDLMTMLQSAGAALRKLGALLATEPALQAGKLEALPESGVLRLSGAGYAYGTGPAVLHDLNLDIYPGETLALVGPTGAGKSTLAKLACRIMDPVAGAVSYGGVDLRSATFGALRERIVMASQEGHLFQGTVLQNIQIGRARGSEDDVRACVRAIGAEQLIESLPGGLHTQVGERGSFLSAGQRQVVSLARVAMTGASVIILDEATSSMDPATEAAVHEAVTRLARGRTLVIIAHRLSTVRRADRVAVIADGGIAELGSPAELRKSDGRYARLEAAWNMR